jgi:TetR/AcrR family transcriptional regulator of autoinduction and epiphytic fitness
VRHTSPGTVIGVTDQAVDPRVLRSRDAVLASARELLVEAGPTAVTVDAVVARSGVAKSTIYRHWASRDELLIDVMQCAAPQLVAPAGELDFESAVRDLVHQVGTIFGDPEWARMIPALMMLKHHEDGLAHLEEQLHREQLDVLRGVMDRGVAAGRVTADYDLDEASAHLIGPLFFAVITGEIAIDRGFCDRIVDRFLAGCHL